MTAPYPPDLHANDASAHCADPGQLPAGLSAVSDGLPELSDFSVWCGIRSGSDVEVLLLPDAVQLVGEPHAGRAQHALGAVDGGEESGRPGQVPLQLLNVGAV